MKITIEISEPTTAVSIHSATESSPAAGSYPAPTGPPAATSSFSLTDLLAKAASLGAINAGSAPSLGGAAPSEPPVYSASPQTSMPAVSAGPPPLDVLQSKGSGK